MLDTIILFYFFFMIMIGLPILVYLEGTIDLKLHQVIAIIIFYPILTVLILIYVIIEIIIGFIEVIKILLKEV